MSLHQHGQPNAISAFRDAISSWENGDKGVAMKLIGCARRLMPYHDKIRTTEISWLMDLGQFEAAIDRLLDFDKTLGPIGNSRYNTATTYLRLGKYAKARIWLDRALNSPAQPLPSRMLPTPVVSAARLVHDFQQLAYLMNLELLDHSYRTESDVIQGILEKEFDISRICDDGAIEGTKAKNQVYLLSPDELGTLARIHRRVVRIEESMHVGECFNENMHDIEEEFFSSQHCRHAVLDNFFSEDALSELLKYCLRSWIWFNDSQKDYGYVGAYEHNGFRPPIVDRLDKQLQTALPRILKGRRLRQIWSYRNIIGQTGVGVHADFSAININVWMTPDKFNLNENSGGLLIYPIKRPAEWEFETYNGDNQSITSLLNGIEAIKIPYRFNRAVIFDSALFHGSDNPNFSSTFEGRRMNMTLLYE
jgi:tetratricopeptide (TPR) repeat protein